MDNLDTKAAWQSRSNLLAVAGIVAFWVQRRYGLTIPLEFQGMVVDVLPVAFTALWMGVIWFRVTARKIIDRWL
jgi:hypothetical protein